MFIAYSATLIDPRQYGPMLASDAPEDFQKVLPLLVISHTRSLPRSSFGAVLSAIMSCSSATSWPSVTFAENIRPNVPGHGDRSFLKG